MIRRLDVDYWERLVFFHMAGAGAGVTQTCTILFKSNPKGAPIKKSAVK
jgi:hypothetical protein